MSNILILNFNSKIHSDKNAIILYWNHNFNSKKNCISIPNEINNNSVIYRDLYLSYLDRLNDHFKNIKVDNFPYWLISSITCKQASFANPFEIKNIIKFIYLESFVKKNAFKKLILNGNVDVRIIKVLKSFLKKNDIELINKSSKKRVDILRKYFSIIKTLFKILFNRIKYKEKNLNVNTLLVEYTSSKNQINYWGGLLKILNLKSTLKLNIDIDSKTNNYKVNDKYKAIFLYNNYSLLESLKKYLKIFNLNKHFQNKELFNYSKSLNFLPLFSELIFKDFIGSNALYNAITISSVKNLYKNNPNISLIIYPRENQAWERILLFYSSKKSISIGNLHAGFKYWDLRNYLNESYELKKHSMYPTIFSVYSKKLIKILNDNKYFSNENFELVESLRLKKFKRDVGT